MIVLSGKEMCVGLLVSGGEVGVIEELVPQLTLRVNLVELGWAQKRLKPSVNSLRSLSGRRRCIWKSRDCGWADRSRQL